MLVREATERSSFRLYSESSVQPHLTLSSVHELKFQRCRLFSTSPCPAITVSLFQYSTICLSAFGIILTRDQEHSTVPLPYLNRLARHSKWIKSQPTRVSPQTPMTITSGRVQQNSLRLITVSNSLPTRVSETKVTTPTAAESMAIPTPALAS